MFYFDSYHIFLYYYIVQYGRTALHAAYWAKNDVIIKMLVKANANNLEAVKTVSHNVSSLYTYVYICSQSLFNLFSICNIYYDVIFL